MSSWVAFGDFGNPLDRLAYVLVPLVVRPLYRLPEDGRWVEIQMKTAKEIDGEEQWTDSGVLRVASVGRLNERGEKRRWIEVRCTSDGRTLLAKVLPERPRSDAGPVRAGHGRQSVAFLT